MRILGFSKMWDKLKREEFTTFRFQREDRDWEVGEQVQIAYKPRSKDRQILGVAKIENKEKRYVNSLGGKQDRFVAWMELTFTGETIPIANEQEAIADGFDSLEQFTSWFYKIYGNKIMVEPINKLTLRWVG